MPLSQKYFFASIGLYLASLASGWLLWAIDGPALLAIVPCLLLTVCCVAMIVAIDRYEAENPPA